MTLLEIWNARYAGKSLKIRTTAAIGKIASSILATPGATEAQKAWATNALVYTTQEAEKAMWFMASNATILASVVKDGNGVVVVAPDGSIEYAATDQDVEYVATVYYQTVTA